MADGLRERARAAGYELREGGPAELVVDARIVRDSAARAARRWWCCAPSGSLAARGEPGAVGFHLLPAARAVSSWS